MGSPGHPGGPCHNLPGAGLHRGLCHPKKKSPGELYPTLRGRSAVGIRQVGYGLAAPFRDTGPIRSVAEAIQLERFAEVALGVTA